ncbi:MAG: hypothetical protein AAFZ92_03220 [Pseudomonadota bacterium]
MWCIELSRRLQKTLDFQRYHKRFALAAAFLVTMSTLWAIEHNSDGSWQMPLLLFYIAVCAFIVGTCEFLFILDKRYKTLEAKCQAVSRAISCYGFAATSIYMCELYATTVCC